MNNTASESDADNSDRTRFKRAAGAWARLSCFLAAFAIGVGYVAAHWRQTESRALAPVRLDAEWIAAPDDRAYSAYFRKSISIPGSVKHAWLAVAAQNSFEVIVNGDLVGSLSFWRHTRPYQWSLSEPNQGVAAPLPAMDLNFPREYQWEDYDNARMPTWLDVTDSLKPGSNTIAVKIETRAGHPVLEMQGAIELWSGEVIPIRTDSSWKAEPVPPGVARKEWTDSYYDDSRWRTASVAAARSNDQFVWLDRRIYQKPFEGRWVAVPDAASDASGRLKTTWELPAQPREAYLRVLANRVFQVLVNGQPLRPTIPGAGDHLDSGQWIVNSIAGSDPFREPEQADPDEQDSTLAASQGVQPIPDPVSDALGAFKKHVDDEHSFRVPGAKPNDDNETVGQAGPVNPQQQPDRILPRSTLHDRSEFGYYAYDVSALLKRGANSIEVRLAAPRTISPDNWAGKAALDAGATFDGGAETFLATDDRWLSAGGRNDSQPFAAWRPVQDLGPALTPDSSQPRLNYRGIQRPEGAFLADWANGAAWFALIGCVLIGGGYSSTLLLDRARGRQLSPDAWPSWCGYCATVLLAAAIVPVCAMILEMSMAERDEHTWFLQTRLWQFTAVLTAMAFFWAAVALRPNRASDKPERSRLVGWSRALPEAAVWNWLVFGVLLFGAGLRMYQIDLQPLEDDEYASVQAVLSIAKTGAPGFVPHGIYYTRSPLYHYPAALGVLVFGENLWALRLPSVLFGVGAAWMTYFMGVRLLRSHWVGFGAMLLMVLHPYEIFTSHIARFYQQQQFFALVTIYWFCKGFVTEQSQKYRYLSIAGLFATVLSHEISVVLGLQFLLCAVLFGRDLGFARNSRFFLLCGLSCLWIFLDWTAYQTLCLTRLEGVSLNLEARIMPHFWTPFNLLAVFVGYSRLHLGLTLFLLLDLLIGGRTRTRPYLALLVILISGVVLINVLITALGFRYQYYLIPIWALLCVDAMRRVVIRTAAAAQSAERWFLRAQPVGIFASVLLFVAAVLSWSPWRIAASYGEKLTGDSTGACRYVAGQIQPGDRVMITEPHPHAAYLEIGRVDYDLGAPVLYDFVFSQKGALVDRNGGAEAVDSHDRLKRVFCANERVWVLISRERFRSNETDVDWNWPGARMEEFIRRNSELKYRSPYWSVYLWDRNNGLLRQSEGG